MEQITRKILTTTLTTLAAAAGLIVFAACDSTEPEPKPTTQVVVEMAEPEAPVEDPVNQEIRKALGDIIRDPDGFARARGLATLLPTLGPDAVSAVKATLEDQSLDLSGTETELLLRFWATQRPKEATLWAVYYSPAHYRTGAVLAALPAWAEADPQAALEAAERWESTRRDVREVVVIALVRGWFAAGDPPELREYIANLPAGFSQQRALANYVRVLIQKSGSEVAARWAESVSEDDPDYKQAVYSQVGGALPLFDFDGAMRWCEAHCDGPHGKNLRTIIARRWVRMDPVASLEWLRTAPEGYDRDLSVRVAFTLWSRDARHQALEWISNQAAGNRLDPWLRPTIPVYARMLAPDSPAEALAWVEKIEDGGDRETLLIELARGWRRTDDAAAEEWLEQSSLSPEAREKVLATLAEPRPPPLALPPVEVD